MQGVIHVISGAIIDDFPGLYNSKSGGDQPVAKLVKISPLWHLFFKSELMDDCRVGK